MEGSDGGCYVLLCEIKLFNVTAYSLNHCFTLLGFGFNFSDLIHEFLQQNPMQHLKIMSIIHGNKVNGIGNNKIILNRQQNFER